METAIGKNTIVTGILCLVATGCGFEKRVPKISEPIQKVTSARFASNPPFSIRIQTHDPVLLSEVSTPGKLTINFINHSSEAAVFAVHPYFLRFSFIGESNEFISRATRIVPASKLRKLPPEMIVIVPAGATSARNVPIPLESPTDYLKVRILARLEPVRETQLSAKARALVKSRYGFYPSWPGGLWSNKIPAISARSDQ